MYKISVLNSYGRYENLVIRIMLYENSVIEVCYTYALCYMYPIIVNHFKWSYMLSVFH